MRILFLNHEFPPLGGGGGKQSMYLAREMARRHQIYFLTTGFRKFGLINRDGYQLHLLPTGRKRTDRASYGEMFRFLFAAWRVLPGVVRNFRPEAVLIFFTIPTGMLAYHPALKNIPYLISARGSDVPGHNPDRFRIGYLFSVPVVKQIWRKSVAVVCNSADLKEEVLAVGATGKIPIIPNGVDLGKFHFVPRPAHDGIKLLYVGRLIPLKNIDRLIQSLPQLRRAAGKKVSLTIVGSGRARNNLESLAIKLGIRNLVTFKGEVPYDHIEKEYRQADIYVQLSKVEGMSNTIVEALACGLPVVTTPVGGVRELQKIGGLVIIEDLTRLVPAIICAQKLTPRRDLVAQMSFQRMADSYNQIINDICAG